MKRPSLERISISDILMNKSKFSKKICDIISYYSHPFIFKHSRSLQINDIIRYKDLFNGDKYNSKLFKLISFHEDDGNNSFFMEKI